MLSSCSLRHCVTTIKLIGVILTINGYMIATRASDQTQSTDIPTLNIGGFFAFNNGAGRPLYGREISMIAQIAIEEINNSTSILPGYQMKLFVENSHVSIIADSFVCVCSLLEQNTSSYL